MLNRKVDVVNSTEVKQEDPRSSHMLTSLVQEEQNVPVMSKNSHVLQSALAIIAETNMGKEEANQVVQ